MAKTEDEPFQANRVPAFLELKNKFICIKTCGDLKNSVLLDCKR
jgi:hypothetical protein